MYDIYCVSAGQLNVKKDSNVINKRNMYLNYGLLSLASIIEKSNLNPVQLHGHFSSPREFINYCITLGITETRYPVFISIPSFYAISWVNEFTKILKEELKISKVVVGGRWVIDGEIEQLRRLLPYVDTIVDGVGENRISDLLCIPVEKIQGYTPLNYNIVDQRHIYQPSIEVSRGCGMKCDFCQEKNEALQPLKSAFDVISEAKNTLLHDDLNPMSPYFEASMFKPSTQWLNTLIEQRDLSSQSFSWRAESRVDTLSLKLIPLLAKSGMKVLDLGLESASPEQIRRMGKSNYPEKYLNRASMLLKIAHEFKIDVKVNILLYSGESSKSIDETYKWLDQHRSYIKGVSVGPVIAFGWDNKKANFIRTLESCGASVCDASSFTGVTNFNLSNSIDSRKVQSISKELSREFMTAKDYFDLKSFSYFSRDYTYETFLQDVRQEKGSYSFNIATV